MIVGLMMIINGESESERETVTIIASLFCYAVCVLAGRASFCLKTAASAAISGWTSCEEGERSESGKVRWTKVRMKEGRATKQSNNH